MSRIVPFYPPEFKVEAVRLVQRRERPLAQIARDRGVSEQSLRNWVKQIEIDSGVRAGLTTEKRDDSSSSKGSPTHSDRRYSALGIVSGEFCN